MDTSQAGGGTWIHTLLCLSTSQIVAAARFLQVCRASVKAVAVLWSLKKLLLALPAHCGQGKRYSFPQAARAFTWTLHKEEDLALNV